MCRLTMNWTELLGMWWLTMNWTELLGILVPSVQFIIHQSRQFDVPSGMHIFQKNSRGHLKFLGIRRVTWSKFHTEDQIPGVTTQNFSRDGDLEPDIPFWQDLPYFELSGYCASGRRRTPDLQKTSHSFKRGSRLTLSLTFLQFLESQHNYSTV
jgi:hypothetical protein